MKVVDIIYRYETRDVSARPLPADCNAALLRLNDGNSNFAALLDHVKSESGIQRIIPVDPRDLGLDSDVAGTPKQRPFAAVLGCSDARVPIELIFNEGPNDLFVIRVAGNGLGMEVLGSLKYAVDHLGGTLKLIAVLGHSGCGAITTAVDVFLNTGNYVAIAAKHSIRSILDRSLIVVQASANKLLSTFGPGVTNNLGYRQALIEASIVTNAALSAYSIQQEFIAHELPELRAAYGVYILETREVWAPCSGNINGTGLAEAPFDPAGFARFGDAVVQSERIASYIR
jgi:carbonic anhydrase